MKRRQGEPVDPYLIVAEIPCSGEVHRVSLPVRGAAVFHAHRPDELAALRCLAALTGQPPQGCLQAVWNLPLADTPVPKAWKNLAVRARKTRSARLDDSWFGRSWPYGRRFVRRKYRVEVRVMKALNACSYYVRGVRPAGGIWYVVHATDAGLPSIGTRVDGHDGEKVRVTIEATVNLDWVRSVRDSGLSVVDGCLVLCRLGGRTREFVLAGRQVAPALIAGWPAALVRRANGGRGLRWL